MARHGVGSNQYKTRRGGASPPFGGEPPAVASMRAWRILNSNRRYSSRRLARMARDPEWQVRLVAASAPNCPPGTLAHLAMEEDRLALVISKNPGAPWQVLQYLAVNPDKDVRLEVAKHPNTPPDTLAQLAADEDGVVRWGVAKNPRTPSEVLAQLEGDKDEHVLGAALENPNLPEEYRVLGRVAQ